ncbi:MAG: hypothetical protein PHO75_02400 [Candidatus Shapirobacteria bacterium]|nr:hypothetical protein [Candidatus Shapirobacteria bacterium]
MQVTYKNVQPLIEGLKEAGRVALVAIISWLLTEGVINSLLVLIFKTKLSPELVLMLTGLFTSIVKGWDKDLHLTGKIEGDDTKTKGLTQF